MAIRARPTVIPGFGLTVGYTTVYLSLLVLLPMAALVVKTVSLDWETFWSTVSSRQVRSAYAVSFGCAFVAALINLVFGVLAAWALVRYRFPGKRIIDALVDLPFALPTAVAGITLTTLSMPDGWIGRFLPFKVAFTQLGIVVALTFIGLPFVVRTVQPVLEDLSSKEGTELEEAAACLGASRPAIIRRVILPELWPAMITGFALAFARGIGEYGSVIFIAGNIKYQTEIAPLMIIKQLEAFEYAKATAIAVVLLLFSFVGLVAINVLQRWLAARGARG
jgi:sulfate transport system permease protein